MPWPARTPATAPGTATSPADDTYETARTFESLGVSQELTKALADEGIVSAFPIQALTVADALAGRDVCGKAKTGSGKTLAFGVPLLQRAKATREAQAGREPATRPARPLALVLLPTRELAVQVHDVLAPLARSSGCGPSPSTAAPTSTARSPSSARASTSIIATPGPADRPRRPRRDRGRRARDARPRRGRPHGRHGVHAPGRVGAAPPRPPAPDAALLGHPRRRRRLLVKRYLTDPVFHEVASSTQTVTLMEHRFLQVHQMDKVKVAAAICRAQEKSLLFVRTKRGADRLVENLGKEGIKAAAIHGDLRQANRERALADFSNGKLAVLVATDVAARGLHIDGVDVVIHYDPPEDHKAYLHRSGRTARAGKAGVVVSLSLWNQLVEMEVIQRRLGLRIPIVEMFSNDPRLADLAAWTPLPEESVL